jgi:hypothetical protein
MMRVRATVNLPGLRRGHVATIDPDDLYMKGCLRGGLVVPDSEQPDQDESPVGAIVVRSVRHGRETSIDSGGRTVRDVATEAAAKLGLAESVFTLAPPDGIVLRFEADAPLDGEYDLVEVGALI